MHSTDNSTQPLTEISTRHSAEISTEYTILSRDLKKACKTDFKQVFEMTRSGIRIEVAGEELGHLFSSITDDFKAHQKEACALSLLASLDAYRVERDADAEGAEPARELRSRTSAGCYSRKEQLEIPVPADEDAARIFRKHRRHQW